MAKITVRNDKELRNEYQWLLMTRDIADQENVRKLNDDIKREIRRYIKERAERFSDRRIISHDGDCYYIQLIDLPEELQTKEDADKYFKENEYLEYTPYPWDCTGQHFTQWYKIFKRRGHFFAYHGVAIDI